MTIGTASIKFGLGHAALRVIAQRMPSGATKERGAWTFDPTALEAFIANDAYAQAAIQRARARRSLERIAVSWAR